jgi:Protein of unknown function (DUF4241)
MSAVPHRAYLIVALAVLAVGGVLGWTLVDGDDEPRTGYQALIERIQRGEKIDIKLPEASSLEDLTTRDRRPVLTTTGVPLGPPAPPANPPEWLDVTLDPSGRPYDEPISRSGRIDRRPLAVLHAPSRRVLFMGGEETMHARPGTHQPVTLAERAGRRYPVHAIVLHDPKRHYRDTIVGVVIVERDTRVVRWREEGPGYGTDAGLGSITTVEWAARRPGAKNPLVRLYWKRFVDQSRRSVTADVDGHRGTDTVIFSNGFGDGGFPSVAGYDASGRRAQMVLWTIVAPWRVAFPEGRPPPQVTKRENELAQCLAGKRRVELGMRCRVAR